MLRAKVNSARFRIWAPVFEIERNLILGATDASQALVRCTPGLGVPILVSETRGSDSGTGTGHRRSYNA